MTTTFAQFTRYQQLTSARVVSTSNLTAAYYNGPSQNGVKATLTATSAAALVIDGVTLNQGDRVLVAGQSAALENGIYIVLNAGDASNEWMLERSNDFQSIEQMRAGQYITIEAGSSRRGSFYVLTEPLPGAVGVDAITFTESSAGVALGTAATKDATNNNAADVASIAAGPSVQNHFATFADVNRTLEDSGYTMTDDNQSFVASVDSPVVIGNVPEFLDTVGTIHDSGTALIDLQVKANIQATRSNNVGGGGAGPITIAHMGVNVNSIVLATIDTSTNAVGIAKATAGVNQIDFLFTGDPGASCFVNYVVFIQAQ